MLVNSNSPQLTYRTHGTCDKTTKIAFTIRILLLFIDGPVQYITVAMQRGAFVPSISWTANVNKGKYKRQPEIVLDWYNAKEEFLHPIIQEATDDYDRDGVGGQLTKIHCVWCSKFYRIVVDSIIELNSSLKNAPPPNSIFSVIVHRMVKLIEHKKHKE